MTSNMRRIANELRFFREDPPMNCTGGPTDDNLYQWICTVTAPSKSMYDGRQFRFEVGFPTNYPFEAPTVQLVSDIFHPNLQNGKVEISCLKDWTPVMTISRVLEEILQLLVEPNVDKEVIANEEAANMFRDDADRFAKTAMQQK